MVRFVVMAAGQATRMGRDKLALPWKESTVLGSVLEVLFSVQGELRVVTRQGIKTYLNEDQAQSFKRKGGEWIEVPSHQPLSETIRRGLTDATKGIQGFCFVPGDQVGLEPHMMQELTETFLANEPDFLVPKAQGITGSPVFFHRRYRPELISLQGEQGGRIVLNRYPESWTTHTVEAQFFEDLDTPEDYERIRAGISWGH